MDNIKTWKIISLVLAIIIIGLVIGIIVINPNIVFYIGNKQETKDDIMYNLDIQLNGKVENVEHVVFSNPYIFYHDKKMEMTMLLNNESETEKVEARMVTVELINTEGKTVASKEVQMDEISEDYGFIEINIIFEVEKPELISNVVIKAK